MVIMARVMAMVNANMGIREAAYYRILKDAIVFEGELFLTILDFLNLTRKTLMGLPTIYIMLRGFHSSEKKYVLNHES